MISLLSVLYPCQMPCTYCDQTLLTLVGGWKDNWLPSTFAYWKNLPYLSTTYKVNAFTAALMDEAFKYMSTQSISLEIWKNVNEFKELLGCEQIILEQWKFQQWKITLDLEYFDNSHCRHCSLQFADRNTAHSYLDLVCKTSSNYEKFLLNL